MQAQPNGDDHGRANITIEFEPWMLAEIRRQLYIDLMNMLEDAAKEAHGAAESVDGSNRERVIGRDLRYMMHRTIGDGVKLLDVIGWDVNGDVALLFEHGKSVPGTGEEE
jgi:hypothetical protein